MSSNIDQHLRFLIVDDFETVRKLVHQFLKQFGAASIVQAANGSEAWELLKSLKGDKAPQFIISDWDMPEMNGLELLKLCKADSEISKIPFVILTSQSELKLIQEFLLHGADGYVKKPVAKAPLEAEILSILSKRAEMSSESDD